jgi:hypothetical protein
MNCQWMTAMYDKTQQSAKKTINSGGGGGVN